MATSEALGEVREVDTAQGRIGYREVGSGPPVVFIHGLIANGDLWRGVVPGLAADHRCIVPDWPLGAHEIGMNDDADLSLTGLAAIVDDFMAALELTDVTLVGNDTGGAIAQMVMVHHPARLARVVLTPCDAFDNFPPSILIHLKLMGRYRPMLWVMGQTLRSRMLQRLPLAFGWVTKSRMDGDIVADSFAGPLRRNAATRRDFARVARAIDKRQTLEAAERLPEFDKPVLLIWGRYDRLFPLEHGERLAELLPQSTLEVFEESGAFVPEDQPEELARAVREFAAAPVGPRAA